MSAVVPFMVIYWFWIAFFAIISAVLGSNANNAEAYVGLPLAISYFFVTFQNSLGNINNPTIIMIKGEEVLPAFDKIFVLVIYFFWFAAQLFLLIVLLNFVIALIS